MSLETIGVRPLYAGNTQVGKRSNNLIEMQAHHRDVWEEIIYQQAPKFWMKSFINKKQKEKPAIANNHWTWYEDGKWYKKQLVADNGSGGGVVSGTAPLITVEFQGQINIIPTDIVDMGIKYGHLTTLLGRVESVGVSAATGNAEVTFKLIDPNGTVNTTFDAADFSAGHEMTVLYNSQVECFEIPKSRVHTPEKYENSLVKISNGHSVCDDASNQGLWFKGSSGSNYWTPTELSAWAEFHTMQCDAAILWGQSHNLIDSEGYQGVGGKGVFQFLEENSLKMRSAGPPTEDDLIDFVTELARYSSKNEWHFICGDLMLANINRALDRYTQGGAVQYGTYGMIKDGNGKAGINFTEYHFVGKTLKFMEYGGFSDPDFLPENDGSVDYRNLALALNMDNVSCRYKKSRIGNKAVKNFMNVQWGHSMGHDGQVVSNRACDQYVWTTHLGVEMKGLQDHGILCQG